MELIYWVSVRTVMLYETDQYGTQELLKFYAGILIEIL